MHLERVYQRVKRKQLIKIFKLFWQNRKQKTYVKKKSLEGFSVSVDLCKKYIYIDFKNESIYSSMDRNLWIET